MTILVTGANGQLGNEMRIVSKDSEDKYIFTDVVDASEESIAMLKKLAGDDIRTDTVHLDITNLDAIREIVIKNNVNVVVNCAAYTNVDAAEDHEDLAELLNAKAPENLAIVMKEVNGLLVHISTDYVFGGEPYNTPCNENQKGTPTGVYGLTKLHGEQAIQKVAGRFIIIRTAWLYSEFGKNFVKTILSLIETRSQINVVFDQVGTPTSAFDLANAISSIIHSYHPSIVEEQRQGVYHFSNEGVCSWYDFALRIAELVGNAKCVVRPCLSHEFPSLVKRPSYSVLDKAKIKETFGIEISYWTDSLKVCIEHLLGL